MKRGESEIAANKKKIINIVVSKLRDLSKMDTTENS
jgi:hypothetical protein